MTPTIKQSLQALFACFPAPDSGDPEQTALGFMMAIEGLPSESVAQAVKRFIRGEVKRDRHTFLPSAPELAREARDCRDTARAAAIPPKALPPPEKPIDPAERERVAALFTGLAKRIEPRSDRGSFTDPEAELEALAACPVPVRISDALIAKLNPDKEKAA